MTSNSTQRKPIKRALISVYDRTGLEELVRSLHGTGVEIVSTGSTAGEVAAAGVSVAPVKDFTGLPECLESHAEALRPRIRTDILADTRGGDHLAQLEELGMETFQLVVINLYPLRRTVASGTSYDKCAGRIDIRGPSMVRVATRNHPSVAIVANPARYNDVTTTIEEDGFTLKQRREFTRDTFLHTAEYDTAMSNWLVKQLGGTEGSAPAPLRYGEDSHQSAVLTRIDAKGPANAERLNGREMSYNSCQGADAAWRAAWNHGCPCVAAIKHADPYGIVILDESVAAAHRAIHACDPMSAFGGVITVNCKISVGVIEQVKDILTEVIVALSYEDSVIKVLKAEKNLRILVAEHEIPTVENRFTSGGLLTQEPDTCQTEGDRSGNWELAAGEALSTGELARLEFAQRSVYAVESNAILLFKNNVIVGIDIDQVNRMGSAKLTVEHANTLADGENRTQGAHAAPDAFLPFADSLRVPIDTGVEVVIQPEDPIRDKETVAAAKEAGVAMYMTGTRHFFH